MITFLLFSIAMLVIGFIQFKKKQLDELNGFLLVSNFLYSGYFYYMSVVAENLQDIKGALLFAFSMFYVIIIPFLSLGLFVLYFVLKKSIIKIREVY